MIDYILEVDRQLFEFLNGKLTHPWLDTLMPFVTHAKTWIPLYIVLVGYLIFRFKKHCIIPLLGLLLTFGVSDYGSSGIIKQQVKRTRPCNETTVVSRVVGVTCRDSYGFPSSHATNHFGIAFFMLFLTGTRKRVGIGFWVLWASIVSYSRIYVGVHYPLDIVFGGLMGSLVGVFFAWLTHFFLFKFNFHDN